MIVDNPTWAQAKHWLLQCYRPIRWDSSDEVGQAFKEIDLCLQQIFFREQEGYLELRFYADRITTYEEFYAGLYRICARHWGRLVDYSIEVERNVRRLPVDAFHTMEYRGPQSIGVVVKVIPPTNRPTTIYHQVLAARAAEHARVFGRRNHPVLIDARHQDYGAQDGDY